ncbi:hypothetical protein CIK00_03095 [Photobacterium carnosum]|uniref:Uncharacterized protein n=2 Tax=Vibrionaceae TaxID=641 RepID=A0A2N4UW80_9GAMM|nr:hypothetical protein CIK00_03095 [Photobacterium carnosum]
MINIKSNITASFPIYDGTHFVGSMICFMSDVEVMELKNTGHANLDIKMPNGEIRTFNCVLCRIDNFINVIVVSVNSNDFKFSFIDEIQPLLAQHQSNVFEVDEVAVWTINLVPGLRVSKAEKSSFFTLDPYVIGLVSLVILVSSVCIATHIVRFGFNFYM